MDAVLLTWRWQNILSIWIMIAALALLVVIGTKISNTVNVKGGATNGASS